MMEESLSRGSQACPYACLQKAGEGRGPFPVQRSEAWGGERRPKAQGGTMNLTGEVKPFFRAVKYTMVRATTLVL